MTERVEQVTPHHRHVARRHQPATGQPPRSADQPGRSAEPVRTKPVRRSVDLSPAYHARLTQWCRDTAEEIGATRVTGQDVIRALVARLLADQNLSRRIRADLRINI